MNKEKAAVLIPIIKHAIEPTVLFILRSHKVKHHKGQVSFPGGSTNSSDLSAKTTALRETEEEIGLKAGDIKILYQLPEIDTASGFNVTPFVGSISPETKFTRDTNEVKEIFEVPLSFLADKKNIHSIQLNPRIKPYTVIKYDKFTIWGATAMMVFMLIDSLPQHANVLATENIFLT